ncbi:LysR family transcriptional regulator [Sulfitobacter sp. F26204]|uniref:LysR family transcriptional regulator n=1 Tax=Sulfitobacter sp. F26204 TaxID=2996014 RepID=UPI00225E2A63|nr:LysR family transcriptional regulator [Sulfitobacter sp. F26204]MCX7561729.1 LysR family transcriptional regulator [Sulfitobacter sp. F26204]
MEFRQLRYFVAVAEEGNFGRAAERLHVSQPPISRQIQALEQELGTVLLLRNAPGVRLTEAGEIFYADAQKVLAQVRGAVDRVGAATRGELGRLNVAFFGSTVYQAVPECLLKLRQAHPGIDLFLTRMSKTQQLNAIREGAIHVGFGRFYPEAKDLCIRDIGNDTMTAAIPTDHPLADRKSVTLAELSVEPIVAYPSADRPNLTDEIIDIFRDHRLDVIVQHVASDSTSALCMAAYSCRCTLVPESITRLRFPGMEFIPISDCHRTIKTTCIYRRDQQAPVLRKLLETINVNQD